MLDRQSRPGFREFAIADINAESSRLVGTLPSFTPLAFKSLVNACAVVRISLPLSRFEDGGSVIVLNEKHNNDQCKILPNRRLYISL